MTAAATGRPPTALYEAALRSADGQLWLRHPDGRREPLPVVTWRGGLAPGDASLLRRCGGPTLDIGCGPGRLAAALAARGVPTLGIDVAPFAVHLARRAGALALRRDVFGPLPIEGRWSTLVLADGNIGIGGDPARLLARAAGLLSPAGRVLVELVTDQTAGHDGRPARGRPATQGSRPGPTDGLLVRLERPDGQVSQPFPWSFVSRDEILRLAATAGMEIAETWHSGSRHFAALGSS